jgi:tetratricopeptide (TPR) repeat protein
VAGWWRRRALWALLDRHREELAAVWPAVRDGGEPPHAQASRLLSLQALLRAAALAGGAAEEQVRASPDAEAGPEHARSPGRQVAPEFAVVLLIRLLLRVGPPQAGPDPLSPWLAPRSEPVPGEAHLAAGLASGLLAGARADGVSGALRPWCLDAALVCTAAGLRAMPRGDPARAWLHEMRSVAAGLRFERIGDQADEDDAVAHARAALDEDQGGARHVPRKVRLAGLLASRVSRTRDSSRLEDAPELVRAALACLDPSGPQWLQAAMVAMQTLITAAAPVHSDIALIDEALELQRAISRHPLFPAVLGAERCSYAALLAERFARRRDPEILDQAIEAYAELHSKEPAAYAAALGRHLNYRYMMRGSTDDRRRAQELLCDALAGPVAPAEAVAALAVAAVNEFRESGDPAVIDRAVAVVTPLTTDGGPHADSCDAVGGLCELLSAAAEAGRVPLRSAEEVARRCLDLADGAADRAAALGRIAAVLVRRSRAEGAPALLDEAVAYCRQALAQLPAGHDVPDVHSSLVMALTERHDRTRHLGSLHEAVAAAERMTDLVPDYRAQSPQLIANLITLLVQYAKRTQDTAELDRGQRLVEQALATTTPGSHGRLLLDDALGSVLLARAELPGARSEAADATVRHFERATREIPDGARQRAGAWGNLAHALLMRYRNSDDRSDLDRALECGRLALSLAPPGDPRRGGCLGVLSRVLNETARAEGGFGAVREEILAVNAELAADAAQPAITRTAVSMQYAGVALLLGERQRALAAARSAIGDLPSAVWQSVDRPDQEHMLASMAKAAPFAAEIALAAGEPHRALELLETGRGVLAAQALELRAETDELTARAPRLAARLAELRRGLEDTDDGASVSGADRRHRMAHQWQQTLDEIRTLDGFQDFLRPPEAGTLLTAGSAGPVVLISVGMGRGGTALLLTGSELRVCPLPELTDRAARERADMLFRAVALAGRSALGRAFAERALTGILDWLWTVVAEPVLDTLGISGSPGPGKEPPRLWWCPTGPLAFLPLHAAGAVPDRVVSSCTPNVRALLRARARGRDTSAASREPLIVAVPELDGHPPLPGALREAECARRSVGGTLLTGDRARTESVLALLTAHRWVHFACHGAQDLEHPSQGHLLLPDGRLTVLDMARLDLPDAEFAYLSACETAVGGMRLPDEALHLSGAVQLAGFPQVIGTLWRVDDTTSRDIAEGVYRALTIAAPGPPPAAAALHRAVLQVRERHPNRPLSWAAHVHFGR